MNVSPFEPSPELLRLLHHHPGRLRVGAARFREDVELATRVCGALREAPGVLSASFNPRTGSVLVEYRPGATDPDSLLGVIVDLGALGGVYDTAWNREQRPRLSEAFADGLRQADGFLRGLSQGRIGVGELIPAVLTATAIYSFIYRKGSRLPRWDNALYWAYSLMRDSLTQQTVVTEAGPSSSPTHH